MGNERLRTARVPARERRPTLDVLVKRPARGAVWVLQTGSRVRVWTLGRRTLRPTSVRDAALLPVALAAIVLSGVVLALAIAAAFVVLLLLLFVGVLAFVVLRALPSARR